MFCVMWLVMRAAAMDPIADSASHRATSVARGGRSRTRPGRRRRAVSRRGACVASATSHADARTPRRTARSRTPDDRLDLDCRRARSRTERRAGRQRGQVRQREQPVHGLSGSSAQPTPAPAARWSQQEVGQADRAPAAVRGCATPGLRPPASRLRSATIGSADQARRQQRDVQCACVRGAGGASPGVNRRTGEQHAPGRTPGRWSTPQPCRRTMAGFAWR